MQLITPDTLSDYELIDTGGFEKLERFGRYVLARPEPQAVWTKGLSEEKWDELSDAVFRRDKNSDEKGQWILRKSMPDNWVFGYKSGQLDLKSKLSLSSFKHVGLFPEQAENWEYIGRKLSGMQTEQPAVLNLFAYTGLASLAARQAGADVTHVDAVKPVISWARANMEMSGLDNIRWVVDDALKFVKREVRRNKKYNGIILDPPAYGRGPAGEKWLLETHINELLELSVQLLTKENFFLVINLYSLGFSAMILENLFRAHFPDAPNREFGELFLRDRSGNKLPLGIFFRFSDQ
ncbi:MAG: oxidoreductase [Cytophagaceae bacterium SCN 52-12]|nr:MAG: oxidoreductase [Cytophagaceae bacterium SCN 52-12]